MARHRAPLALAVGLAALVTTGCVIQLGDYALGSECSGFSEKVQEEVEGVYGTTPQIDNLHAGEGAVRCSFDVVTGEDLAPGDTKRVKALDGVQTLLEDTFDHGVEVALVYGDERDFALLDTSEGPDLQACQDIAKDTERLVAERYGDDQYSTSVSAPATDPTGPDCLFQVVVGSHLALPINDPVRADTALAVQAALPADTEAKLVYIGSNDIITPTTVRTETYN